MRDGASRCLCFDGGEPRRGVHAWRVPLLDVALADVAGTALLAWAAAAWAGGAPFWAWFAALVALGEAWHAHCGVCTRVLRALGAC